MFDALAEFAVARRQFGAARVELPSEFRVVALQIGYLLRGIGKRFRRCCFPPSPIEGEGVTYYRLERAGN